MLTEISLSDLKVEDHAVVLKLKLVGIKDTKEMRSSIYTLVIALMVAGCSPMKQIARLQERGYLLPSSDTIYVPGEPRDTTIRIYMAGDTVVKETLLFVEGERVEMEPVEAETELAYARAEEVDGKIILTLEQKEAFFEHNLEGAIRVDTLKVIDVQIEYRDKIPKSHTFYKFWFFISIGLILITIILRAFIKKR